VQFPAAEANQAIRPAAAAYGTGRSASLRR